MSFDLQRTLADLPRQEDNWFVKDGLMLHATTLDRLPLILKDGLRPRCDTRCKVWDDDVVPYRIKDDVEEKERICQCRTENVYFWNSYQESIGQALTTVAYLKEGTPAIVLMDARGLELEVDDEIHPDGPPDPEDGDPTAFRHKGSLPAERVLCHCHLREDLLPSVGSLLCSTRHGKNCGLVSTDVESLMETYEDASNWECECRDDLLDFY